MPRKQAFSGKAKKAQLQAKRERKNAGNTGILMTSSYNKDENQKALEKFTDVDLNVDKTGRNRYKLLFKPESKEELKTARERAMLPLPTQLRPVTAANEDYFQDFHDFPKRPDWKEGWSRERLESNEQRFFREYVNKMIELGEQRVTDSGSRQLSQFELNLETWRQLWRVIEKSDILLLILDVRYAAATFPPSLFLYVRAQGKKMILVLNKIDLIPAPLAAAWKQYFQNKFPSLHVVFFTSFPSYNMMGSGENKKGMKIRKRKGIIKVAKEGSREILKICQEHFGGKIPLDTWKDRLDGADEVPQGDEGVQVQSAKQYYHPISSAAENATNTVEEGVLTIGTLGHPNVGKSSLINSLCGKKVVSVSRTPGHTKHFQTIFLTKTVQLCDCPGLVFPSQVEKPLQVLMGSYPISQLREPYSVVQYLAERIHIPAILNIQMEEDERGWSAFQICERWAAKKGLTTARTSRPDTYRAANHILRFALEGRICLTFEPPGYQEDEWLGNPDTELAKEVTATVKEANNVLEDDDLGSDGEEDEDSDDEELRDNQDQGRPIKEDEHESAGEEASGDNRSEESEDEETVAAGHPAATNKFALLSQSEEESD